MATRSETLPDGREVHIHAIGRPDGVQVEVIDYGCIVGRICVPGPKGCIEVTPNHPDAAGYVAHRAFLDPVIGRFANRLDKGRFSIDGHDYQVDTNERTNTLHGGKDGFDTRIWRLADAGSDHVEFALTSPDGDQGFPGKLEATARYSVSHDAMTIAYTATTDRPTPVNLTQHLYFNLSGRVQPIMDHTLRMAADAITVVRPDLIPTGELRPVAGGLFDFRKAKRVGEVITSDDPLVTHVHGIDLNWVLEKVHGPQVEFHSPESGLTLEITTDQPGMQVYSGQGFAPPFVKYGAMAFEPQGFPDAPNHPNFPSAILRPGQTYRHTTVYRFKM
jgi:aldose 1-epimerase